MTTQEILELAGHRHVPPWVMKLVADCLESYKNSNLPMTSERNFCSRCGKRLGQNDWDIHTCSLPDREISVSKSSVSEENVPIGKSLWRKRQ